MQNWEEYEADYFRGMAEGYEIESDEKGSEWGLRRGTPLCPADKTAEMIRDMDRDENLFGPLAKNLLVIIRRICDAVDGDGCIAMDGALTEELKEMLVDHVLEEVDQDEWVEDDVLRELITSLLFGELLRRRYRRRRMGKRNSWENSGKRWWF